MRINGLEKITKYTVIHLDTGERAEYFDYCPYLLDTEDPRNKFLKPRLFIQVSEAYSSFYKGKFSIDKTLINPTSDKLFDLWIGNIFLDGKYLKAFAEVFNDLDNERKKPFNRTVYNFERFGAKSYLIAEYSFAYAKLLMAGANEEDLKLFSEEFGYLANSDLDTYDFSNTFSLMLLSRASYQELKIYSVMAVEMLNNGDDIITLNENSILLMKNPKRKPEDYSQLCLNSLEEANRKAVVEDTLDSYYDYVA